MSAPDLDVDLGPMDLGGAEDYLGDPGVTALWHDEAGAEAVALVLAELARLRAELAEWRKRRTLGGPAGDFTYGWRNAELPPPPTAPNALPGDPP